MNTFTQIIFMNKMLEFFNKISGLIIFLIFIVVFMEHIHHAHLGRWGHHRNFGGHPPYGDTSTMKTDTAGKK
jgi:hypothetical protein